MSGYSTILDSATDSAAAARSIVRSQLASTHAAAVVDDAALIASELVTNAVLHGHGRPELSIERAGSVVRIGVRDGSPDRPLPGTLRDDAMTGRGLRLVEALASRWGVDSVPDGKEVWAELTAHRLPGNGQMIETSWNPHPQFSDESRFEVLLGDVPTGLLLDAKAHMDNLVREFTLAKNGAESGESGLVPAHIVELTERVVGHFAEARRMIKEQALEAAERGEDHVTLRLDLPASAAAAGAEYLRGLDEAEEYCRSARLLTLESPPQHKLFRHWYVEEIIAALRRAVAGEPPEPAMTFEERMLSEIGTVSRTQRAAEAANCIFEVASALGQCRTLDDVAAAVLRGGTAALSAAGASIVLTDDAQELYLSAGTLRRRRAHPADVDHTDGSVGESVDEYSVPLTAGGHRLGWLRFRFSMQRSFEDEDSNFVLGLAAMAALALERIDAEDDAQESIRHLKLLADTSAVLADHDIPTGLDGVSRVLVPAFADWLLIHLLDADDAIHCAVSRNSFDAQAMPGQWSVTDGDALGVADAMRTGLLQLHPDLEGDARGVAVVMPLLARGAAFGALTFVRCGESPSFPSADIALCGEVARRVALTCDNASLLERVTSEAQQAHHGGSPTATS